MIRAGAPCPMPSARLLAAALTTIATVSVRWPVDDAMAMATTMAFAFIPGGAPPAWTPRLRRHGRRSIDGSLPSSSRSLWWTHRSHSGEGEALASETAPEEGSSLTRRDVDVLVEWTLRVRHHHDGRGGTNGGEDDAAPAEPAVEIRPSSSGHGNGLFLTRSASRGSILFVVPSDAVLALEDAWDDPVLGEAFGELTDRGGDGGKTATLAGFVAYEILKEVNRTRSGGGSQWGPYLGALPRHAGENGQDHVLWWDDRDVETLLGGSNVYEEVLTMRQGVDDAVDVLRPLLRPAVPWVEDEREIDDAVRAAFVSLLSRAFEDEEVDCHKLIPLLDMAQAGRANVRHETNAKGDVVVRACRSRDLKANEEVLIEYADDMELHRYFAVFGFVPGFDQECREMLRERNVVFFPPG